jgi:SLOG in TRPM, prokaryote
VASRELGPNVQELAASSDAPNLGRLGPYRSALDAPRPVLAISGTTEPIEGDAAREILRQLTGAVAAVAAAGAVIVTGGTDAGVFHLLGQGLSSAPERPAAVVGVAPAHEVAAAAGSASDAVALAPLHDGFVLTPGTWGDETPVRSRLVSAIAGGRPAVMLLVGGGAATATELVEHLRQRRAVVVLDGSGRLADQVARAVRMHRPRAADLPSNLGPLVDAGAVHLVPVGSSGAELQHLLEQLLAPSA